MYSYTKAEPWQCFITDAHAPHFNVEGKEDVNEQKGLSKTVHGPIPELILDILILSNKLWNSSDCTSASLDSTQYSSVI